MSRSLIRARQPQVTRLFPHDRNKRFILPSGRLKQIAGGDPPLITVPPFLTGQGYVGQPVDTSEGNWLGNPASFTYSWWLNGFVIGGAVSNRYTPQPGDIGGVLESRVSATNAGGTSAAVPSSNTLTITDSLLVTTLGVEKESGQETYGYITSSFGTLAPTDLDGETVDWLFGATSNGFCNLKLVGGNSFGNDLSIRWTWDGGFENDVAYNASFNEYSVAQADLAAYIASMEGNDIIVRIEILR